MESYRIYKSLPVNDFMAMTEFAVAKVGLILTPLIQNFNYYRKRESCTEDSLKKRFMESVRQTLEKEESRLERGCDITELSEYYMLVPKPSKREWFTEITDLLRDYSEGNIWSDGTELLCKTESEAECLADMLETLYKTQGEEVSAVTGYYDPDEDRKNNKEDRYTGWWYVTIE